MGLHLRGEIWQADYYAYGRRVQESTGSSSKREAERFLALRLSEVQRGVYAKRVRVPLPELWERYFAYAKLHKRSWKRDEQMYGHLSGFFGPVTLDTITPLRVEEYQQHRVREVCPSTVNRESALLKHMFNMAERWDLHNGRNPVRLVKFLPEDNLQFQTLTETDEKSLLMASPPYLREMIIFALNVGLRTNEIFNLRWEDVDIEERRLKLIVRKNRKPLSLPLNEEAFAVVKERHAHQHGPYVFYNPMTGDKFQGREGRACGRGEEGRAQESNLAHVPAYLRFASHPHRCGPRDREGSLGARQHQHHSSVRAF